MLWSSEVAHHVDLESVLRLAANGDVSSERYLMDELSPRLASIARYGGVPPQDVEDLVQQTLLAACVQFRSDPGAVRDAAPWLAGLLRHKIADYYRAARTRCCGVSYEAEWMDSEQSECRAPACACDNETAVLVREVLRQIETEHRLILLLNVQGGFTIVEIARRLGRSPGRVGALLAEAKETFREIVLQSETKHDMKRLG